MYLSFSIKPSLKKVSKYENKFAKLQKKAGEFNLRSQLKNVKKKEFTMDEEEPGVRVRNKQICQKSLRRGCVIPHCNLQTRDHAT